VGWSGLAERPGRPSVQRQRQRCSTTVRQRPPVPSEARRPQPEVAHAPQAHGQALARCPCGGRRRAATGPKRSSLSLAEGRNIFNELAAPGPAHAG
jgi:hypothetical protein